MAEKAEEKFIWVLKNGDLTTLEVFVNKENVNKQIQGRCPLHYAADYGQTETIKFLLSKNADIDAEDKYGMTPLLAAIFEGHKECVQLLLQKGADKNRKSPHGASYLECAEKEEIRALLQGIQTKCCDASK